MPSLKKLIHEIHRRSLWQVLGIYLAGSWITLQVVEQLVNAAGLPDWVQPLALVLLLVGFPLVMATAFVQEGVGGQKAAAPVSGDPVEGRADSAGVPTDSADSVAEAPTDSGPAAAPSPAPSSRLFTWRNAAIGGVVGFAVLGLVTVGYMAMRTMGIGPVGSLVASGVIEKGETIILADFAGDSALAAAATMAFRVDLAQSPIVSAAEPSYLAGALERMERDPESRLDLELAREVAIREGIKAVIAGDIGGAGGGFVLSVRLVAAESGEDLAAVRETAGDSSKIIPAIDKLSRKLRERLGESLRTIRAGPPLDQVTTGSLEALRKYSRAWAVINAGDNQQGLALLEEALALDSTFAMAWRKLATVTGGDRRVEAATKAYEYRDKLTDRERYHTLGIYQTYVTEDPEQAVTAYRTLLATWPDDAVALNNLGVSYGLMGEREQAAEMYRRAMEVDPLSARYPSNLVILEFELGRPDSARASLARFEENLPEHPNVALLGFELATAERDYAAADDHLARRLETDNPAVKRSARWDQMRLALVRGKLSEAEELREELTEEGDELEAALVSALQVDLSVRDDTAGALQRADEALARYPMAAIEPQRRPYDDAMLLYAAAGRPDVARRWVEEWVEVMAQSDSTFAMQLKEIAGMYLSATELIFEGKPEEALPLLRQAIAFLPGGCDDRCAAGNLAPVYDLAGQPDSVIAHIGRFLAQPEFTPLFEDAPVLHRVYSRLGKLYDERGDLERAAEYYAKFVALWEEADEELQPRVRAARQRLEEILAERG